jgi:hypothetical protein
MNDELSFVENCANMNPNLIESWVGSTNIRRWCTQKYSHEISYFCNVKIILNELSMYIFKFFLC